MITNQEIINLILQSRFEISEMDTKSTKKKTVHRLLSKSFVSGLGKFFKEKYKEEEHEVRFQGFSNGKGISGEWLYDLIVVRLMDLKVREKVKKYASGVELVLESEFEPGMKSFLDDFSKLLVINSQHKVYIHGVKNKSNKIAFVEKRMKIIEHILHKHQSKSKFLICFVDHPALWENENTFVKTFEIDTTLI